MEDKIKLVLNNVQKNASCHQKYLKILTNCYHKISSDDFMVIFFKHLTMIFHTDIAVKNPFVERTLDFLAQFVCVFVKSDESELEVTFEEDSPSHPFLTRIINETLKYHDLAYTQTRYYSCRFITLILKHIGYETHLDGNICDAIQEAMLERTLDPKPSIRLQAVMALVRLQEPLNPDCPVIKAYQSLLTDANPLIRKEVVKMIAPNTNTRPRICERISDVDFHVRMASYSRCADIGPMLFKIVVRQQILKCGFHETNSQVKNVFLENLLPKWLTAYNGNFLAFLSGLKLDADENDITNTEEISKQVMAVFFKSHPIKDIIEYLPLDSNKLIPLNNLSSEFITYWSIVTSFLRSADETEEYLEDIMPELTPFCNYIQNIIDSKTSEKMKDWEYLDFQYILYNLFDMAEQYDFSDEVGRRTFHKLVMTTLQHHKLQFRLAKKVVVIADKLISNVNVLGNEICQIISDIREPLVDQPTQQKENADTNFQMAELKVKVNILQGEIEDALDNQDFKKAAEIQNELMEFKRKLEEMNQPTQVTKVRVSKDDPETVCRCLDLLTTLLLLPSVKEYSPSLETCKTEFVIPLLTSDVVEINWRVLKCITLYSFLDKGLAEEHLKILCIPIATYRAIPNYNKFAVTVSVSAVCDLMNFYGPEIFGTEEDTNNTTSTQNTTRRRLYRNEDTDDMNTVDHNRMNVEFIIEIILDMLDDENEEIRETAVTGITKLILTNFPVNPLLMSRIILKWFNPLTEKNADKIQQKLGFLISNYTKLIKGAREVIEKAVIPTLTSIANAPRSSPLADVDIDNVLRFLAAITDSSDTMDILNVHANLAHSLCIKIASKPSDPVVLYLSKMLLYLEISVDNTTTIRELITQAGNLLEEEEDGLLKGPRKHVMKFVEKLKALQKSSNRLDVIVENSEENVERGENQRHQENNSIDGDVDNENSRNEVQNHHISTLTDKTEQSGAEAQNTLIENGDNANSNKEYNENEKEQSESIVEKENNTAKKSGGKSNANKKRNVKKTRRKNINAQIKDSKNTTENNTSDTDDSTFIDKRCSKRLRRRTNKLEVNNKQKDNKTLSTTTDTITTTSETDIDKDKEKHPSQQAKGLNNAISNEKDSNKISRNQDQCRRSSRRGTRGEWQASKPNKRKVNVKRQRDEVEKPVCVSKKHIDPCDKQLSIAIPLIRIHKAKEKNKNNIRNRESTRPVDDYNTELRRSKRPRPSPDTNNSSSKSRDSEKENSKDNHRIPLPMNDNENNNSFVPARRSNGLRGTHTDLSINSVQPVAESTRNISHRTLRSSNVEPSLAKASEMNVTGVKRRKSRGKKSLDLDSTGETTLHTIVEQSFQVGILDDMTIQTPTSNTSSSNSLQLSHSQNNSSVFSTPNSRVLRRSRVIISETSSDSETGSGSSSVRRSARKIKKKNMDNYVLS